MKKPGFGRIINAIMLGIFGIICFYPFYYLLIYSFSYPKLALSGVYLIPRGFTFSNYIAVFSRNNIMHAIFISASRTVVGTIVTLLCSSIYAYGLTKKSMITNKIFYKLTFFTLYINAGLIPWYLTMRFLGLKDNFMLYILPFSIGAFYVILMKTYFEHLPNSIEESAMIDGANYFLIYSKIIMPLSKPILATTGLFAAVNQWNSWVDNFYLNHSQRLMTLQLLLLNFLRETSANQSAMLYNTGQDLESLISSVTPTSVRMTITIVAILPVFLVYPFLQKYFMKGILLGAIKG